MRRKLIYGVLLILIILMLSLWLGCDKKNPTEPRIRGGVSRVYSSVQLVGDFNGWDISNPVVDMGFKGDYTWEKTVALTPGTYEFKFATGYSWDNDNFGDNETPDAGTDPVIISGNADKSGGNISLEITDSGMYTFRFNDLSFEYSIFSAGYIPTITDYTVATVSVGDTFVFKCNVTDQDGTIDWVKVHYWNNAGGSNTEVIETLNNTTGDTYISTVMNTSAGGEYLYYFEARDNDNNMAYFPIDAPTSKETVTVSDFIVVDGIIDSLYESPVASDPSNDGGGNDQMDLVDLYVYDDADNYYFLFTVDADITNPNDWGKYIFYIDTSSDANGATSDAWGRSVTVNDPHKPEYSINTYVDVTPYGTGNTQFFHWNGSAWDAATTVDEAALLTGTTSNIEYRVSKSSLGNPSTIWVEVYSTGNGGTDNARDTINNPPDDWNGGVLWDETADLDCSTEYNNQN